MKTVMVTGSTGSLGQAVINYLQTCGDYKIIATSRNADDPKVQLDVSDHGQLAELIRRESPRLILHLAATFVNDFDEAYAVNVEASRQLLETVRQSGLGTRVLLIGSAAEYGVVYPEENPVREDHVLNPVSIYGLTKAWQTQLAGYYSACGVDTVVARVFNLEGDNLSDKLFIGRLQKQIDEVISGSQSVIELGPLTASRDYVTIDEAAEQIHKIAEYGEAGQVYHVASGKAVVMRDILLRYLEKNKLDISIVRESAALSNRAGYDVPVIYADVTKTSQLGTDNL
jgi:GDP-4-dehydro-6-deoxy-D-mannose reductase